ncbi:MAG TPA: hypothetical protein DCE78_02670 [Bacteroidetes bacterium]|nr:hypothetical protein [Bacteroidota bacterium]
MVLIKPTMLEITLWDRPDFDFTQYNMLFFSARGFADVQVVRDSFRSFFQRTTSKNLSFLNFRQVVDCFAGYHLKNMIPPDTYRMLSDQAGHSIWTASENYGDRSTSVGGVTPDLMTKNTTLSDAWWRLMDIVDISSTDNRITATVSDSRPNIAAAPNEVENVSTNNGITQLPIGLNRNVAQFTSDVNRDDTLSQNDAEPLRISENSRPETYFNSVSWQRNLMSYPDIIHSPYPLEGVFAVQDGMRRLEGTDSFTCPEQLEASLAVRANDRDVLVILPTGKGKTSVVLVNVILEQRTTVFIVPLLSIQETVRMKCAEKGIPVMVWNGQTHFNNEKLVIVTVERATSDDFISLLSLLQAQGRLQRIVVDEVHLVLLWQDFRDK